MIPESRSVFPEKLCNFEETKSGRDYGDSFPSRVLQLRQHEIFYRSLCETLGNETVRRLGANRDDPGIPVEEEGYRKMFSFGDIERD